MTNHKPTQESRCASQSEVGLFTFNTANLGDEMQSFAVLAHLNRVHAFLDRDHLADVKTDQPTACVFNSWFLLGEDLRVPSSQVQPIWHGFCLGVDKLLDSWLPYFQSQTLFNGPIGCRDLYTTNMLTNAGVPAEWSGCLTLFLGRGLLLPKQERNGVLFVDVPPEAERHIPREIVQSAVRLSTFPPPGIVHQPLERWAAVGRLVSLIAQARLVVTRRLHVALPAASLDTPVVAIPDANISNARQRFSGFDTIIPTVFLDEVATGLRKLDWKNLPPPRIPTELARRYEQLCTSLRGAGLFGVGAAQDSPLDLPGSQTQWLANVTRLLRPARIRLRLRDLDFELPIMVWSDEFIEVGLRGFPGLSKFDFNVEVLPCNQHDWIYWGKLRDLVAALSTAPAKTGVTTVVGSTGKSSPPRDASLSDTIKPMPTSGYTARKLCLASCFLPLDETNCRWWKRYQDALNGCGMELVLLSSAPAADHEIRTICLPLWLQGFAKAYGIPSAPTTLEASLVNALAARDRAWSKQDELPVSEFANGVAACQHVLRTIVNELKPAAVLVWGTILPQSVLLQQLALQQGLPCWVIERGLLPDTLMIEMVGQVGQSELNWSFTVNRALRESTDTHLFAAAQKNYLAKCETKYIQAEYLDPEAFRQKFNPKQQKLVAAFLQYDTASNLFPADYAGASIHTTGFENSTVAIRQLGAAASRSNCLVIVKPHPLDQEDYSSLETPQVRVVRDVNLHSLIQAADVAACLTSSTQFEVLLYEKPLLLLARSPLANKGIAYEPRSADELDSALAAALQRKGFAERMVNARRFIHFLLRDFSIGLSDTSLASPKLPDLAAFVAQNCVNVTSTTDVNERIAACGDWLTLWESTPKKPLNLPLPANGQTRIEPTLKMNYQSHIGQDAWVAECLGFKRTGYFLDFGAFDGKTISNTYALEKDLGWKGICVEPNPRYYPQVCECRNCVSVNVALWPKSRELLRFVDAHGLSAIESFKDGDINTDRRAKATKSVIEVDTLNPNELLARFNAPKLIDYLTLDVEGAEFDILSALDLKTYAIALMTIEHNHDTPRQQQIRDYLAQYGYEVVQNRNDDFFFHRQHLKSLTGRNIDPVSIFQRIYETYPIDDGAKTKPTPAPKPNGKHSRSAASQLALDTLAKSPEALRAMCATLRQQGSWTEAGEIYTTLTNKLPDDLEAWRGRLECARKLGHVVMADLILEEALERHPEWVAAFGETADTASATMISA